MQDRTGHFAAETVVGEANGAPALAGSPREEALERGALDAEDRRRTRRPAPAVTVRRRFAGDPATIRTYEKLAARAGVAGSAGPFEADRAVTHARAPRVADLPDLESRADVAHYADRRPHGDWCAAGIQIDRAAGDGELTGSDRHGRRGVDAELAAALERQGRRRAGIRLQKGAVCDGVARRERAAAGQRDGAGRRQDARDGRADRARRLHRPRPGSDRDRH